MIFTQHIDSLIEGFKLLRLRHFENKKQIMTFIF